MAETEWREELLRDVVAEALATPEIADGIASIEDGSTDRFAQALLDHPEPLWDAVAPELVDYVQAKAAWEEFEAWAQEAPVSMELGLARGIALTGAGAAASVAASIVAWPLTLLGAGVFGGLVAATVTRWVKATRPEAPAPGGGVDDGEPTTPVDHSLDPAAPASVRESRWREEAPLRSANVGRIKTVLRARLLERAVLPALRAEIDDALVAPYELVLGVAEAPGLGQLGDPTAEITPAVRKDVDQVIGPLEAGTVGVAGPRGSGKTTLLLALTEGRLKPGGREFAPRCFVKAPVRYDTREFLLHLTRELCEKSVPPGTFATVDLPADRARLDGPDVSWSTTNRFREGWNLKPIDRPWGRPTPAEAEVG